MAKKKKGVYKKKTTKKVKTAGTLNNYSVAVSRSTGCYIINNDTNEVLIVPFNPTEVPYDITANYSQVDSPGMSYPLIQYANGSVKDFNVQLFYYGYGKNRKSDGSIKKARKFLEKLVPPEKVTKNYKKPPTITFAYGYFVKKCVVTKLGTTGEILDSDGEPVQTTFSLDLRQVSN